MTQQEREAIFAKFSLTAEQVDFEITDDMNAEQLSEKLEAFVEAHKAEGEQHHEVVSFSLTYREKQAALEQLCSSMSYVKKEGDAVTEELYCCMMDFDDDAVYYSLNLWTPDNYACKKKKRCYSMKDGSAEWCGEAVDVFQKWLTAEEIQKLDDDKMQLEALTQFKEETEKAAYDQKVASMLEKFSDVAGLQEYAAIKEEAEKSNVYDTANFEMRLFALRGMQVRTENKPQTSSVSVSIGREDIDDDGYGGLVNRARNRRK